MDLFIITGGSKGLGEQILKSALDQGHYVLNISRSKPKLSNRSFKHLSLDLSRVNKIEEKYLRALKSVSFKDFKKIHLINNAALLNPVGALNNFKAEEIQAHLQTNIIAPILLSSLTAQKCAIEKKSLTVINIGSGAGFKPIPGWSLYCTSKAALKMWTECLSENIKGSKTIHHFYFSPGVLDTQMQRQIRGLKKKDFPQVAEFKKLKAEKKLRSPQDVGRLIVDFCLNTKKYNQTSSLLNVNELAKKDAP